MSACVLAGAALSFASSAPASAAPSPCAMFSAGDVGAATGGAVTDVRVTVSAPDRWTCTYTTRERIVTIATQQFGSPSEAAHFMVERVASTSDFVHQHMQKIHGMKDLALLLGQTLHLQHGARVMTIADIGGSTGEEVAIAKTAR